MSRKHNDFEQTVVLGVSVEGRERAEQARWSVVRVVLSVCVSCSERKLSEYEQWEILSAGMMAVLAKE